MLDINQLRAERQAEVSKRRAYRVQEVADMLGVNARTLRGWIAAGHLRVSRPAGRVVLIEPVALDEFLARNAPAEPPVGLKSGVA